MTRLEADFWIDQLGKSFLTGFQWISRRDAEAPVAELAIEWAELIASALNDVRLTAPPTVDDRQPFLPFIKTHRIGTELFHVAQSGMRGGPRLDLILQIWFDTEHASGGFGVPLLMQRVPRTGAMPEPMWHELRETAQKLNVATPSGRVVLLRRGVDLSSDRPSDYDAHPVVMNSFTLASTRSPPHPVYGRRLDQTCHDLASGWIGDPALSGRESSPVFDEILGNFHVGRVLRIAIRQEGD